MKRMILIVFLCSTLLFVGCKNRQITAGGQRDTIVVLSENNNWLKTKDALTDALGRDVFTPNRETVYELVHGLPENLSSYIYGKNILIIGYLDTSSEASNLISTLLTADAQQLVREGKNFIFEKENPWAFGQYLLIISSPGKPELNTIIEQSKNTIFDNFEKASYERAKWLIYSAGRDEKKEKKISKLFNFSLELPVGFLWIGEDSIKTFVKLVRKYPFRLISFGWKEKMIDSISYDKACRMRDSIGLLYLDNDKIERTMTKGKMVDFLGRNVYKLDGIWENDENVMGGPFRTYFFNDTLQNRSYIIDIHIFAPGKKKWFYLKELEGVVSTFKTYPLDSIRSK